MGNINDSNTIKYNVFNDYPAEIKSDVRNTDYIQIITNFCGEMFDISEMSHDYSTMLIRTILLYGSAYLKKQDNGKYIICGGQFVGIPDPDEIYPSRYLAVKAGFRFDGIPNETKGETIVYLNPQLNMITQILRFASQFAEIDTSLFNNLIFSRVAPIAVTGNEKTRIEYENALNKMLQGELNNSILSSISLTTDKPLNLSTIDISNADYAEKIQYLSMYHEQLISRLARLCGINYNFISKQANITNDELHNSDDYSCIYPLMFKKFLNLCLNKIGLTAEFSEPWSWINHINSERYNNNDDNTEDDPTPDDEQKTENDEPTPKDGETLTENPKE